MISPAKPTLLYSCRVKALRAAGEQLQYGLNWAFSRRGRLKVYNDHLTCGDWRVEYSEVKAATLYTFRSTFYLPGHILKLETADRTYHFGLNGAKFWKGELPFPVEREKAKLRYSWPSLLARIVLIGYLVHLLWKWLVAG